MRPCWHRVLLLFVIYGFLLWISPPVAVTGEAPGWSMVARILIRIYVSYSAGVLFFLAILPGEEWVFNGFTIRRSKR